MPRDSFDRTSIEGNRQQCVDCEIWSPTTETNYTLISTQCGWRLSRSRDPAGQAISEWRCPDCWKKHRINAGRTTR